MKTEVAIIGGGPGGCAAAMFLLEQNIKPLLIESEDFPRYHVGESMTGSCTKTVNQLGLGPRLQQYKFPAKKGVRVFGTGDGTSWFVPVADRDPDGNLVPATAFQVRRSVFDKVMLEEAVARGTGLLRGKAVAPLKNEDGGLRGVQVRLPDGTLTDVESKLVIDASGMATFLAHHNVTGPKYLGNYDRQVAFFSQVTGAVRDNGETRETDPDNTLIFYKEKYHWAWFIPLDDNVVSVGVVTPVAYFTEKNESREDFLKRELRELNPVLTKYLPEVKLIEPIHSIPNYSYQVRGFTGKGYVCLGDAHRFVDPIFSFGLNVTIREASFLAPVVRDYLDGKLDSAANPFKEYEKFCEQASDVLEDVVDSFWEYPLGFAKYVHYDYRDMMTDMFAGRIYEDQPSEALIAMRKSLKRERSYDTDDYSVPPGSRYHPERARIWEGDSPVQTTEQWMSQTT